MFSFHLAHIIEIIMFYKAKHFHPPIRGCIRKVNIGNVLRKGKTCFLSHRNSIRSGWRRETQKTRFLFPKIVEERPQERRIRQGREICKFRRSFYICLFIFMLDDNDVRCDNSLRKLRFSLR